jgi:hypothetical protein
LAGIPKSKTDTQDKRRLDIERAISERNMHQQELFERYTDKSKRIDFIQKLINQSNKQKVIALAESEINGENGSNLLGKIPGEMHIRQLTIDNGHSSFSKYV